MATVFVLYSIPMCEDEETCSCHWDSKNLSGIYTNQAKAKRLADAMYPKGDVEEIEIDDTE